MTSFKNKIKPDSTELERYFLSVYTGNLWDALEKIKDWHSPEHIEKEVQMKLLKLQQQALPVVPECVAELFNEYRFENIQRLFEFGIDDIKSNKMIKALMWRDKHPDTFSLAFITGKYEVEKPQLFYIELPKVSEQDDYPWVNEIKNGIIVDFTDNKSTALKLTEQEIKSIDERYWQFAVPVEDNK